MNQKQQININVNELKDIPCECGSLYFSQLVRIKHVSALQSPDGKEGRVNMTGMVCVECGKSDTEAMKHFEKKQKEEFELAIKKN